MNFIRLKSLFITWMVYLDQLAVGLLPQLVERCTGIAEVMGSNPCSTTSSVVFLAARISYIRFFTAVQKYKFQISKIII